MDIRQRIINAYKRLATTQGLDGMTMDQLSAAAGVSKRTLYRYFPSKEDVITAAMDEFMQAMAAHMDQTLSRTSDPEELIAEMMTELFKRGQFWVSEQGMEALRLRYPDLWARIDAFRQQRIRLAFSQIFGQPTANDVDTRIAMAVILAAVNTVLTPEFILSNNLTFEQVAMAFSRLVIRIARPHNN